MNLANDTHNPSRKHMGEEEETPGSDSAAAQSDLEIKTGTDGEEEQVIIDAYDKAARKVNQTYEQAKNYSNENPGKAVLIALGIGAGLGFLLGASTRRSRIGRIAKPVVHALSDIALAYFR